MKLCRKFCLIFRRLPHFNCQLSSILFDMGCFQKLPFLQLVQTFESTKKVDTRFISQLIDPFLYGWVVGMLQVDCFEPLIIRLTNQYIKYLTIRINPIHSDFSGLVDFIESKWKKYANNDPFELHFLDDTLDRPYSSEVVFRIRF